MWHFSRLDIIDIWRAYGRTCLHSLRYSLQSAVNISIHRLPSYHYTASGRVCMFGRYLAARQGFLLFLSNAVSV